MALDNREIKAAIEAGDLPAVKRLLGTQPGLLHQPLPQGLTPRERSEILRYRPLTYAAVLNRTEILDYLLAQGGDALEYGNFPMCRAVLYNRCVPAMEILLAHGGEVDGVGKRLRATADLRLRGRRPRHHGLAAGARRPDCRLGTGPVPHLVLGRPQTRHLLQPRLPRHA